MRRKAEFSVFIIILFYFTKTAESQQCCPHDTTKCELSIMTSLRVPEGFCLSVFANVPGSRAMHVEEHEDLGTVVFVSSQNSNAAVYAVIDSDSDGISDEMTSWSQTATNAGVTFEKSTGSLWVTERTTIRRYQNVMSFLANKTDPIGDVMYDQLSSAGHHGKRYSAISPDGDLFVGVGSPCNTCVPEDESCTVDTNECFYGTILRVNITNKDKIEFEDIEVYAKGVRNSVGFDWNPVDNTFWFTDNGRDNWGNDRPPCELNAAPEKGLHFGFPYCHGNNEPDEGYNKDMDCSPYRANALALGAHVAPLGMSFYTGSQFPAPYNEGIFITEHGSWNRLPYVGFRVTHATVDQNRDNSAIQTNQPILEGFLTDKCSGSNSGRPSDVEQLPDGSIIVADGSNGVIWRIHYDSTIPPSNDLGQLDSLDNSGKQTCAHESIIIGLAVGVPLIVLFCVASCAVYLYRGKKTGRNPQSIFSVAYERQQDSKHDDNDNGLQREQGQEMPFVVASETTDYNPPAGEEEHEGSR